MRRALSGEGKAASPDSTPLGADEFSALTEIFKPFPENYSFAIALSGGPDSTALAFCAKQWATHNKFNFIAFIVDHGLRDESAAEAQETQKRLKTIGIPAEILHWEHPAVTTKIHVTARKARYQLLAEACHRHGIRDLWLAHQQEDQAETILMRLAKGTGIDGLAGISAETMLNNIRLLRPFLGIPKLRLISTCRAAQMDFIEDASNQSGKFARGRLRRVMPLLADEGLTVERLIDLGARAADARDALDHYTHEVLCSAASRDYAGVVRIDLAPLRSAPRAIAGRVLGLCLQAVHAETYVAEYASLMRLLDALRAMDDMPSRTLHGCLVSKSAERVTLMREVAVITDAQVINPGQNIGWDGRWKITLEKDVEHSFTVRPLGSLEHDILDRLAPNLRHDVPQGRARASLPGLWRDKELALIPSLKNEGPARAQLVSAWPPV